MRRITIAVVCLAGLTFGVLPAAQADEGDKRAAQEQFSEGQRAFAAGDYRRAATAFEEAYRRKPHHSPLWNAARSWQKAGEATRAANLYVRFLREAPAGARDRDQATAALADLASKLGRVVVIPQGASEVRVDASALDGDSVYVPPGEHVIDGKFSGALARRVVSVDAGKQLSVTLEPPPAEPAPAPPVPPSTRPESDATAFRLPWTVVLAGGLLTAAAGGVTIWSGLDTNAKRKAFDDAPTQANYDDGQARQLRTNIALGVTGGLAVLTGVAAIFVDWSGKSTTSSSGRAPVWARPYALLDGGGLAVGGELR